MCSLCPAVLPHDSFMTRVCWYLTHCVGLFCSMPSASHLGGGVGISSPPLLICYRTHCGTLKTGAKNLSFLSTENESQPLSPSVALYSRGPLVGFSLSKNTDVYVNAA